MNIILKILLKKSITMYKTISLATRLTIKQQLITAIYTTFRIITSFLNVLMLSIYLIKTTVQTVIL